MTERVFQVLNPRGIRDGNHVLDADTTTAYNGYALKMATDGEVEVSSAADDLIFGLLYEHQQLEELPTTENVATNRAGKRVGVVRGDFQAAVSRLLFEGTQIPTAGDIIWNKGDGTLTTTQPTSTSGTPTALGYCIGSAPLQNDSDIGNSYQTVATVAFHIDIGGIF